MGVENVMTPAKEVVETLTQIAAHIPPSLVYAQIELESIQKFLPVEKVVALYGEDATREALWDVLPEATHAHFACHRSFNPVSPLLLAKESHLTLRDLLNAKSKHLEFLRLAVLSACQTAITDFRRIPDELVGLFSGFLQAGVPSVIGTLWSVDDMSTALLVTHFYELYLFGDIEVDLTPQSPARALRLTQLWLSDLTYKTLLAYLKERSTSQHFSPTLLVKMLPSVRRAVRVGQGGERPFVDPYNCAAFVYYGAL